jgi:hypothetical protein
MPRTEDLLNDNGPSPSMSMASKGSDNKTSKGDGMDKDHIAVCRIQTKCRSDTDKLGQHLDLG